MQTSRTSEMKCKIEEIIIEIFANESNVYKHISYIHDYDVCSFVYVYLILIQTIKTPQSRAHTHTHTHTRLHHNLLILFTSRLTHSQHTLAQTHSQPTLTQTHSQPAFVDSLTLFTPQQPTPPRKALISPSFIHPQCPVSSLLLLQSPFLDFRCSSLIHTHRAPTLRGSLTATLRDSLTAYF